MTLYFEFDFVLIFKVLSVYVEPLYSVFTIFKFCIDIMTEMPPITYSPPCSVVNSPVQLHDGIKSHNF